jgi:protein TonB
MLKQFIVMFMMIIPMIAGCSDNSTPGQSGKATQVEQGGKQAASDQDQKVEVDEYPQPVHQEMPVYPESAKKEKREGTVWVSVLVAIDGSVKETKVMSSENASPDLEKSAVDAAKKWTFKPATKEKKPVEFRATIPFRFRLK